MKETESVFADSTGAPDNEALFEKDAGEKKERKRRGSIAYGIVRDVQRTAEASSSRIVQLAQEQADKLVRQAQEGAEKLIRAAQEEGEKITRKTEEAANALILAESREREGYAQIRADLNTVTGGAVERLVRVSPDEDIKARLREKGWRV